MYLPLICIHTLTDISLLSTLFVKESVTRLLKDSVDVVQVCGHIPFCEHKTLSNPFIQYSGPLTVFIERSNISISTFV